MHRCWSLKGILLVLCLIGACGVASAQSGGLVVVVSDTDGQPLPGATVTLSHDTGAVKTATKLSNAEGEVSFPVLSSGRGYAIEVAFPGLATVRVDDLRVPIGGVEREAIVLTESLDESVKVTASREVIALDKSESSTRFTDEFISDLPVAGRSYQNVLTLAPGVQDSDGDGNPNVHGSRSRDFQTLVGGVSNVDPLTGQWLSRINPNSIEELQVIQAGAGVEFGRAQGGFARIVQKQGSNAHEGVAEFYWRTSKLDGQINTDDPSQLVGADFQTRQPMIQLTGPVVRDKLWYRVSYEEIDREEPIDVLAGVEVVTDRNETRDAQVTWQVSPRNKVAINYRADPAERTNVGVTNLIPAESSRAEDRDVETYSLIWTAPVSTNVLVNNTFAWQELNIDRFPMTEGERNNCVPNTPETLLSTAQCYDVTTQLVSGSYARSDSDRRQRFTVKSQATLFAGRMLGANHQFKLGLDIENERYYRELRRDPTLTFRLIPPSMVGEDTLGVATARIAIPRTDAVRATGTNWGLYVEDQIKPLASLTLTIGARIDREEITSDGADEMNPQAERQAYSDAIEFIKQGALDAGIDPDDLPAFIGTQLGAIWPVTFTGYEEFPLFKSEIETILCQDTQLPLGQCKNNISSSIKSQEQSGLKRKRGLSTLEISNTNVSPFFSVGWSPTGDGKTALKAAVGRHYNNIPLLVPLQELEPVYTDVEYRVNLTTEQAQIANSINPTTNIITVDRDLKTPYQDEFTLSFERELWAETSIGLTYINRRFRDQLQDININVSTGDFGTCRFADVLNTNPIIPILGGDGELDDCAGAVELIPFSDPDDFFNNPLRLQRPDGQLDLYLQNPFWGDVLEIGNYNEIDYEAYVLELVRRQFRGWELSSSYTYSEARGDGEDFFQELDLLPGEERGTRVGDTAFGAGLPGFQSYDQRHVAKLNATTVTPWGVRLGTSVTWQSGLPFSRIVQGTSLDILPPDTSIFGREGTRVRQQFFTGQRNDQRNPSYWNIDLRATREFRIKRINLQLSADVFNVLDEDYLMVWNPFTEEGVQVNGTNEAFRRRGRQWQVGFRISY